MGRLRFYGLGDLFLVSLREKNNLRVHSRNTQNDRSFKISELSSPNFFYINKFNSTGVFYQVLSTMLRLNTSLIGLNGFDLCFGLLNDFFCLVQEKNSLTLYLSKRAKG